MIICCYVWNSLKISAGVARLLFVTIVPSTSPLRSYSFRLILRSNLRLQAVVAVAGVRKYYSHLQPIHDAFAQDADERVRQPIAASIHEIARIVGSDKANDLVKPIFVKLLGVTFSLWCIVFIPPPSHFIALLGYIWMCTRECCWTHL